MKDIKLVVFDMAGTTVNEDNVVYKTVQKALREAGADVDLDLVLEFGAGKEKSKAIADVLEYLQHTGTEVSDIDGDLVFSNFKTMLKEAYANLKVTPYDGVEELFETLKSKEVKVVLNTGYDQHTAKTLMQKLGWKVGHQVDALITADDVINGRPSSEMIDKAMDMFQIEDPAQVLKAGDSIIDIEEGQNANCGITVGVLTGAHTRTQLETINPTVILDALHELAEVLYPAPSN
nr:HAD-IA family hydrolase [Allomuricauda sp.]